MKILIIGASGSGTTTLAKAIKDTFSFKHLDVDNYYWENTDPPFQEKIPLDVRREKLFSDLSSNENTVVSGSLVSWGNEWLKVFDLTVFIRIDPSIRMQRLKDREVERYGSELETNPQIQKNSKDFLEWASKYDDPKFEGRSIKIQQDWVNQLSCQVLNVDGGLPLNVKIEIISAEIELISN